MKTKEEIQRKCNLYGDIALAKSKEDNEKYEANYFAGARDALWWVLEQKKWF